MTWLLIVIAATGSRYGGYAVTMQDFTTRDRCEVVRQMVVSQTKATAQCVER